MAYRSSSRIRSRLAPLGLVAGLVAGCGGDSSATSDDTGDTTGTDPDTSSDGAPSTSADTSIDESSTAAIDSTGTVDTSTGGEPLTRIEQILADLTIGMYECPDRVWPDIIDNYHARQVLLSSIDENTGWMWNDQVSGEGDPPRVTMGALDGLPPEWSSTFNVGSINGVPTLGISLDETAIYNQAVIDAGGEVYRDFASILTFHEAFHFLSDQNDWNVGNGSRSAPYPEPWEPRYLRAELIAALRAALADGASLGPAAHWQARLLAEFPAEMADIGPYDVTEGSAEYASIVSSVLAAESCAATEEVLLAEAIAHLDDAFQGTGFTAGREPYDLGVLAGLLLRQAELAGWELAQENGAPPVEQLLEGVAAAEQPENAALQAEVQAAVDERNVYIGMEIDPMLEALASPEYYRVVVSFNWIAGSFGLGGFYYLPDEPGMPEVYLTLSALFDPPSGIAIDVAGETVLVGVDTPCSLGAGSTMVLTLPVADVVVNGATATSTSATATFTDLAIESATDLDGLEWLCPVDAGGADDGLPEPGVTAPSARPSPRVVRPAGDRIIAVR